MLPLDENERDRLNLIDTVTTLMERARGEDGPAAQARNDLVVLYYGAAFRYLCACLQDREAAHDLAQQFAIRLLQGGYVRQADPGKGRFRDYLKRSLQNLMTDYRRRKSPLPLPEDSALYSPGGEQEAESDRAFLASLRDELIAGTWAALGRWEAETGTPYATVLRVKSQDPQLRSAEIARRLTADLNRPFTESGVRKILHRARDRFAEVLVAQVRDSLESGREDTLEDLLTDLGLYEFCRPVLEKGP